MIGIATGRIGGQNGRPTFRKRPLKDENNNDRLDKSGNKIIVSGIEFTIWTKFRKNPYVPNPNGGPDIQKEDPIKCYLPASFMNVFDFLAPGRLVMVVGDFDTQPNQSNNTMYKNMSMLVRHIELLDTKRMTQMARALNDMVEAGIFNEQECVSHLHILDNFYKAREVEGEAPRLYLDETVSESNTIPETDNPDIPDF